MARRTKAELLAANKTPRSPGEGSVFWIPPTEKREGFWRATRTVRINEKTGFPVLVTGSGKTEAIAIERRNRNFIKALSNQGVRVDSAVMEPGTGGDMLFRDLLSEWLIYKTNLRGDRKKIQADTRKQYESLIRLYLSTGSLGRMKVKDIKRRDITKYLFEEIDDLKRWAPVRDKYGDIKKMVEVPRLGPSNRRAIQGIVRMVFRYATFDRGYIENNPAASIDPISKKDPKEGAEAMEKTKWIARSLAQHLQGEYQEARWILAAATGIRQSEALGLELDSFQYLINPKTDQVPRMFIKQQLKRDRNKGGQLFIERRLKSRSSERVIPLAPKIAEILREYLKIREEWTKSPKYDPPEGLENLFFIQPFTGRPISPQRDNKNYRRLLRKFELPYVRQHALRHFTASTLIASGHSAEVAASVLGHGSVDITRAVYIHSQMKPMIAPLGDVQDSLFEKREE